MQKNIKEQKNTVIEATTSLKKNNLEMWLDTIERKSLDITKATDYIDFIFTASKYRNHTDNKEYRQSLLFLEKRFSHYIDVNPEIISLNIADSNGIILTSLQKEKGRSSLYSNKFVDTVFWNGLYKKVNTSLFFSDIKIPFLTKNQQTQSVLIIAAPIIQKSHTIWSIILEIDTTFIDSLLKDTKKLWKTWEIYLVWRDGKARSSLGNTIEKFHTEIRTLNKTSCFSNDEDMILQWNFLNYKGISVFWTFAYLEKLDMCLLTEIQFSEVLLESNRVLFFILWIWFLLLTSIYIFISFIVKSITLPLSSLESKVKLIDIWDVNDSVIIDSKDEIWSLSESFQKMLIKLRSSHQEIKSQVQQQTQKIREQQKNTTLLNKQLEKFRQALDRASDFITILDKDFKVVYINQSFSKETGYYLEDSYWKLTTSLWRRNETLETMELLYKKLKNSKQSQVIELTTRRTNNTLYVSKVHISPILDEQGEIDFYLTVEHDITQEKNIKLMKDEFISIASHELRTPMTVIKWFTSLFLEWSFWKINTEQKEYMSRIHENVTHLIDLVNDMLDIWKLESGKTQFHISDFDIHLLLTEVQNSFTNLCKEKNIELSLISSSLFISTDKEKLKQVLINLMSNAYKFTSEWWKIEIILSIIKTKRIYQIQIKDNGIGIKKEDLWKLFKKFSQVETEETLKQKGTGLGLALCKNYIEALWWVIEVQSEYKKWSLFSIQLPIKKKK